MQAVRVAFELLEELILVRVSKTTSKLSEYIKLFRFFTEKLSSLRSWPCSVATKRNELTGSVTDCQMTESWMPLRKWIVR